MIQPDLTIPVLGLNLDVNPLAAPKGSLAVADNILLRKPGSAEPCYTPVNVATGDAPRLASFAPDASTHGVRLFCQGDTNVLAVEKVNADTDASKLRLSTNAASEYATVPLGSSTRSLVFNSQRTQHTFTDGRHFLTSDAGVIAVDGVDTSSNQVPRLAGLPSPATFTIALAVPSSTIPTVAAAGKYVAYKAIFRRRVGNTYTLYSAPTRPRSTTSASDFGVQLTVALAATENIIAGDEFVVYRTPAAATAAELGDVYRECARHTFTSAEITAATVSFYDQTNDAGLNGAELYTDPGQDGPLNPNYAPPLASDVVGYANSTLYVNKRAWPTVKLQVGQKFGFFGSFLGGGYDATDRTQGIGGRYFAGVMNAAQTQMSSVSVEDRVGLAVNQIVYKGGASATIASITGGGPYTVTFSNALAGPGAPGGMSLTAYDSVLLTFKDSAGSTITTGRVPLGLSDTAAYGADTVLRGLSVPGIRYYNSLTAEEVVPILTTSASVSGPELTFVSTDAAACASILASALTNGANYANTKLVGSDYQAESVQDGRKNILWYSKLQQPEAVSPLANIPVGTEEILRVVRVGTVALAFCTDGAFTIVGDAYNGFQVQPLDPKCVLFHPSAVATLGNNAYALTYNGIARISEGGIEYVSANAVDTLVRDTLAAGYITWELSAVADSVNREVRFAGISGKTLVFNETTQQWSKRDDGMIHGCFDRGANTTGRYQPDVLIATANGYYATENDVTGPAAAVLKHNPATAQAPTQVKQWVDTFHLFEDGYTDTGSVSITFDGLPSRTVTPATGVTVKEAHCRVPKRAARKPRLTVGFTTTAGTMFQYSGFGVNFRAASKTVKR